MSSAVRCPQSPTVGLGPAEIRAHRRAADQILCELGRGGTGAVFEAHDDRGERVAIKVLHPMWRGNEEVVERFVREARVLMRLKSPHIGKLIDVGNLDAAQGSLPYLALEYLEGEDLDRVIESSGPVPYRQAFSWCADACDALAEAHGLGVIHRDLKPSNLFLATQEVPALPIVKVLDFGIAAGDPAGQGSRITNMGVVVGSPSYMSPEQMMSASEVDPRSDIWSMGALLYELVTGHVPFPGDGYLQIFANVMTKPPLPLRADAKTNIPEAAEQVLLRCLRRPREERFESMTALASALRVAVATTPRPTESARC